MAPMATVLTLAFSTLHHYSPFFIYTSLIAYSLLQYKATLVDPIYLFRKQLFYFPN